MRPAERRSHKILQTLAAALFWVAAWQVLAQVLGHGGIFLSSPLQTVQALAALLPSGAFWGRIAFSGARILAGFALALAAGAALGAASARWGWVSILLGPPMQLIRAMPVASFIILALLWVNSASLSVLCSFVQVLPVLYAGVRTGIADTDRALLEMARVYRLPWHKRLRYLWVPGAFPALCESCVTGMGMAWKSGIAAEVIGLPDHGIGDALYRAKITLSTPDVFAWTLVIVLLSAGASALAAWGLRRLRAALCGGAGL